MLRSIGYLLLATFLILLAYIFYPILHSTGNPLLILNMWNEAELPRNFRTTSTSVPVSTSDTGLKELKASGSAQFSELSLDLLIKTLGGNHLTTIVDLRQESHGFINGVAVSWYAEKNRLNIGKSLGEIEEDEKKLLTDIAQRHFTMLYASKKFPIFLWVKRVDTEAELALSRGLGYVRIPITDHMRPTDRDVDDFINFIKTFPKDSLWLHFHCAAGEGRTSTFMVMYDMLRNATRVSLEDIFQRQYLLGGINFLNETSEEGWKKPYAEERKAFLYQFYKYCQQNPLFQKSWSGWLAAEAKKG